MLARLTERLRESAEARSLSSTLLYRIRDTLIRLCGWRAWNPGDWGAVPPDLDVRAFLRAEILQSLTARSMHNAEADAGALTALVLDLLQRARTPAEGQRSTDAVVVGVDALLLARFLADSDHEQAEGGA